MHFEGTFYVKASKDKLFNFLMDPSQISKCLPDLRKIDIKSSDDYTAVVRAGISFIRGDFTLHFTVAEKQAPIHAKLISHGTGIGSSVDLTTIMDLADSSGGGTDMKWQAEVNVGGNLASVGQRLIGGQAEKIMKQLFDCIEHTVAA